MLLVESTLSYHRQVDYCQLERKSDMSEEYEVKFSPLCQTVERDAKSVEIMIYEDGDGGWILCVGLRGWVRTMPQPLLRVALRLRMGLGSRTFPGHGLRI